MVPTVTEISTIETMPSEEDLKKGALSFEKFFLRPARYSDEEADVRIQLAEKLGGWRIKDQLVLSTGLEVGDAINVDVKVLLGPGLIEDEDDADLFVGGECADWLIDRLLELGFVAGAVIDCRVRFNYAAAPVGENGREVMKVSLVMVRGYRVDASSKELDATPKFFL